MAYFILNRDLAVRSTSGYAVVFEKDKKTFVPTPMINEVLALGAVREDAPQAEHLKGIAAAPQIAPADRVLVIRQAVDSICDKNDTADFSASGMPKIASVMMITGFTVDKRELNDVWQQRNNDLAS